jgi:putative hemolysin
MALSFPLFLTFFILLLLSAFFSMAEAAFLAVNKVRLRHMMKRGSSSAKIVYQLLTQMDHLITTLVVSNNLVNTAIAIISTVLLVNAFGMQYGPLLAMLVASTVLLVFGDITPKIFAARHADRVAVFLARPLQVFISFMKPVVILFEGASRLVIRILGGQKLPRAPLVTEEELKMMIEMGREAGAVTENELRLLQRIFAFEDALVKNVMIPREQIVGIEVAHPTESALDALIEEGHSRLPIYQGDLDNIVGVIYARDLLAVWRHGEVFVLSDLVRPAYFISPAKRVDELLRDFQKLEIQIAIVQDEKKKTIGLVTLEDLLEEIVGEIHEEIPKPLS